MSDPENVHSPVSVSPPRTWDFAETLFVVLIADGAFYLTYCVVLIILLPVFEGTASTSSAQFRAVWMQGNWLGVGLIVGSLAAIAVLWIAVRRARRDFAEYLALDWPSRSDMLYAFALMAILFVGEIVVASAVGAPRIAADYLIVKGPGGLLILLIGGCIAAPVMEEFVVRGFMFRGWSESFLGPIGAIVLTSALWAMNHTQYGWFAQLGVFISGLALGHFRWRSNSTWLPVMVHSAWNILSFFMMGPYT